jgi:hypothetical protein
MSSEMRLPLPILPPPTSYVSSNSHRNHGFPLISPTQWSFSSGLDAPLEYPSPPMTDSPITPNRTQFPEERPAVAISALSAAPTTSGSGSPETSGMASQILPAPSSVPPYVFGGLHPAAFPDSEQGLQPRIRSQTISSYDVGYISSALPPQSTRYSGVQPGAVQFITGPIGPMSVQNIPKISRPSMRRAKAHVARACQNCKKAHLSCDENRPCGRCVATRKEVCV